jgi:hypothetical protein
MPERISPADIEKAKQIKKKFENYKQMHATELEIKAAEGRVVHDRIEIKRENRPKIDNISSTNNEENISITIFPGESEKQAIERIRQMKEGVQMRHRNNVIFQAEGLISGIKAIPDIAARRVLPPPGLGVDEFKKQQKRETPRKITEKLQQLRKLEAKLQDFPKNFDAYVLKNKPVNWRQYAKDEDQFIKNMRKTRVQDFEIVDEAKGYIKELMKATKEALDERQAELLSHENEINPLVRQCTELVAKLNHLHKEILKDKRKAEVEVLSEKQIRKIVDRIKEWNELNHDFDIALDRLAVITVHKPEVLSTLPRPTVLPMIPAQIKQAMDARR